MFHPKPKVIYIYIYIYIYMCAVYLQNAFVTKLPREAKYIKSKPNVSLYKFTFLYTAAMSWFNLHAFFLFITSNA